MSDTIKIPVQALMRRQPDGTYKMAEAEYAEVSTAYIAKWLADRFPNNSRTEAVR